MFEWASPSSAPASMKNPFCFSPSKFKIFIWSITEHIFYKILGSQSELKETLPNNWSTIGGIPICPVIFGGCLSKLYFQSDGGGRSINTLLITSLMRCSWILYPLKNHNGNVLQLNSNETNILKFLYLNVRRSRFVLPCQKLSPIVLFIRVLRYVTRDIWPFDRFIFWPFWNALNDDD